MGMADFDELRWRPEDSPRLAPDELEAELGRVVARGRRQKGRRRAVVGGSLAMTSILLVAAAVTVQGPDEHGVRAVDRPDESTTTSSTVAADSTSTSTAVSTPANVPEIPRPPLAVVVRDAGTRDEPRDELAVLDSRTGKVLRTIYRSSADVQTPQLSPDRKHVYFIEETCGTSPVVRVRVDGPPDQEPETVTQMTGQDPSISADGRFLAYFGVRGCDDEADGGPQFSVRVRNLADGGERVVATGVDGYIMEDPSWSPDGKSLAVSLQRWEQTTATTPRRLEAFVAVLDVSRQQDAQAAPRVTSPRQGFGFVSPTYLPEGRLFVIETPLGDRSGTDAPMMLVVDARSGRTVQMVATGDPKRIYQRTEVDATGSHLMYISRPAGHEAGQLRVSSLGARTTVLATGVWEADW